MTGRRSAWSRLARMQMALAAAVLAVASVLACRGATSALGDTPAEARAHADELLGALESFFGPSDRDPRFESVRPKLARAALAPSRVFDDPSVWTARDGASRAMEFVGARGGGRYRIAVRPAAPAPARPADYHAHLRLRRLGPGEYEWSMREELSLGAVTASRLARALTALYTEAERLPGWEARQRVPEALPRTAVLLGRLFSLDTLRLAPAPDGATAVIVEATLHPEGIEGEYPRYAAFLRRYASPTLSGVLAHDRGGPRWWEAHVQDSRFTLRLRLHRGSLAPLDEPPRLLPESLGVRVDYSTKVGIFRVGFRGLEGDVGLERAPRQKAFTVRFQREPDWELPFLIEPLLRGSLRRPFEGEGSLLAFGVRDGAGDQTLVFRDYRIAVRESWIVRWLGGLLSTAVSDYRRGAERESHRFYARVLRALRADVLDLAGGPGPATPAPSP